VRQNPITQSAVEQPAPVAVSAGVEQAMAVAMRGCDELLVAQEFINKLVRSEKTQKPLRIKLGLDPTAPDLHLGHTVVLNKLRQLQDLGHTVIFLIGDFTALIGDPTQECNAPAPIDRGNKSQRGDLFQAGSACAGR